MLLENSGKQQQAQAMLEGLFARQSPIQGATFRQLAAAHSARLAGKGKH